MAHPPHMAHMDSGGAWLTTAAAPPTCPRTWSLFFLLGCGVLAPWNAFISAADYYEAVFPGRHVDRLLTVCYLPVCWAALAVVVTKGPAMPARGRILCAFATFLATMLAVPLLDYLVIGEQTEGPPAALALILVSVAVVGLWDGLSQAAVFGEAAPLAPEYTHAIVGGTAWSGLLVSLLRITTKALLPDTLHGQRASTALYFCCAAAISGGCFVAYAYTLPRCAPVRAAAAAAAAAATATADARVRACAAVSLAPSPSPSALELARESAGTDAAAIDVGGASAPLRAPLRCESTSPAPSPSPPPPWPSHSSDRLPLLGASHASAPSHGPGARGLSPRRPHPSSPDTGGAAPPDLHPLTKADSEEQQDPSCGGGGASPRGGGARVRRGGRREWRGTARRVWRSGLALALVYVVTLAIFPGFLAEDVQNAHLGSWYPILLIALFNLADLVGKTVPLCALRPSQGALLAASVARFAFLPAFVAATLAGAHAGVISALTALLGVSNGFLTALIMTRAAEGMEPWEADLCETLLVFCLVGGLTVGAFCGWLWLL